MKLIENCGPAGLVGKFVGLVGDDELHVAISGRTDAHHGFRIGLLIRDQALITTRFPPAP